MDRRSRNLFVLALGVFVAVTGAAAILLGSTATPDPDGPPGASQVVGVITRVESTSLDNVTAITVRTTGGDIVDFAIGQYTKAAAEVQQPGQPGLNIDGDVKEGKGNQVFKFSPDGRVLMTLGKAGKGGKDTDVFDRPTGIAFAPNGDIFISEGHAPTFGNSRIVKFDKNGKFIKSFGRLGSGDGELKGPHVLAFDSKGRLFAADRSNSRVVIFDQDGKFVAAWKQFGRPSGIFIDKNDMLYVSDSESEEAPGKDTNNPGCKRGIRGGSIKDGKVQFYIPPPPVSDPMLPPPEGVAVDSHGTIYAAAVQAKEVYKYVRK
jgi:sugar lactone lactonase YvrE